VRIYLVEPDAKGRVSGGYRYNHGLADASDRVTLVTTSVASLSESLGAIALGEADWLLLDSLFLEPAAFEAFALARRTTGCQLGLMLHAFPSFVARADRADKPALLDARPTENELELLRQLDVVICPGPYGPRVLRQSGIETPALVCPPAWSSVGPSSVRAQTADAGAPLRVLTVGNVTRGKGYQDAVLALSECGDLDWEWHIIGSLEWDPEWVLELRHSLARAGLTSRTHFSGQLSPEATAEYYASSDVFLLASFTENHPLVVLEARAHGLPVVGYRVGGVPDIVVDAGLLVSPFDVTELAVQLRRLLTDSDERARLKNLAFRDGEPVHWSESAARLHQQLLELDGEACD
jgi:glycosyltransferase involved in cell wall biosynthesis